MTTFAINEAKIKLAWREKYLTDGANERGLDAPPGAYRGYRLAPRPVADTYLRLTIDPDATGAEVDSFAVVGDRATGFSVSVRETGDVDLDCAALFGSGLPADQDWWVSVEASYVPNATTTANYRIEADVDPRVANPAAVVLGVIPMLTGAVDFSAFTPTGTVVPPAGLYEARTLPVPTAREAEADFAAGDEFWGLMDGVSRWNLGTGLTGRSLAEPTEVTIGLLVGVTKFQLTGTFYVGTTASAPNRYFWMMEIGSDRPLMGSNRGRIGIAGVYRSDGVTILNPITDADANGFYVNPYIKFSFTDTVDMTFTGMLRVRAYQKRTLATLGNEPAAAFPLAGSEVEGHATTTRAKEAAGTPTDLSGVTVTAQLAELLAAVNARIETVHYDGTPGDWVLLWRSHHAQLDTTVTKETSSIYCGDKGLLLLTGGYIKISDGLVYAGIGTNSHNVTMIHLTTGASGLIRIALKAAPTAGSDWDITTGWDAHVAHEAGAVAFGGVPICPQSKIALIPSLVSDSMVEITPGEDATDRYLIEATTQSSGSGGKFRRYVSQNEMFFTCNCYWENTSNHWHRDVAGIATMVAFTEDGVASYYHASADSSPWADADWTASAQMGYKDYAYLRAQGETRDRVKFGFSMRVPYTDATTFLAACPCTYHMMWPFYPTTFSLNIDQNSTVRHVGFLSDGDWDWANFSFNNPDSYGVIVGMVTHTESWVKGDPISCFGTVDISA